MRKKNTKKKNQKKMDQKENLLQSQKNQKKRSSRNQIADKKKLGIKKIQIKIPESEKPKIALEEQIPLPPEEKIESEESKQRKERADKGKPRGSYKVRKKEGWSAPFDLALLILCRGLAKFLNDPKWEATEEEAGDLSLAINTLLDEYAPDKNASPGWILLLTATGSYLLPRMKQKKGKPQPVKKEIVDVPVQEIPVKETPLTEENLDDYKPKRIQM